PMPALASDWPALAVAARRILEQRRTVDPQHVEKGRLTEAEAAARLRVATALVAQWDSIAAGQPPYDAETAWIVSGGTEGTYPHELRTDLNAAADRARALADRHGEDAEAAHFAEAVAALAWHARPPDHISNILDVAHANAAFRLRQSSNRAAA
ncbi:hypothetical protein, partial [Sphingomonas sp. T9W2]|uniref:hypothetical protein n=1 Tax=Sphingomonas sp. T9W2 TaxID=3143183 RepID=UPI0031F4C09B